MSVAFLEYIPLGLIFFLPVVTFDFFLFENIIVFLRYNSRAIQCIRSKCTQLSDIYYVHSCAIITIILEHFYPPKTVY